MSKIFPFNQVVNYSPDAYANAVTTANGLTMTVDVIDAGDFLVATATVQGTCTLTSTTNILPTTSSKPDGQPILSHPKLKYEQLWDNIPSVQGYVAAQTNGSYTFSYITAKVYNTSISFLVPK